jgi:hypothetical protein
VPQSHDGWITPERAAERARLWRATLSPREAAERIEVDRLLTRAPVRASAAPQDDGGVDDAYASLWPPRTRTEVEERERQYRDRLAAAAPVEDDELYYLLFPEARPR